MLPASVTTASGAAARARAASSGIAGTGAQTITMAAPATASSREGAARTGPRVRRQGERRGVGVPPGHVAAHPRGGHRDRGADQAGADDRDALSGGRGHRAATPRRRGTRARPRPGSAREWKWARSRITRRHRTLDRDLARAHQRHAAQAHPARGLRGERRAEIVGDREQDADQVVLLDGVALEHGREQPLGGVEHDLGARRDRRRWLHGRHEPSSAFPPRERSPRSDKATCR